MKQYEEIANIINTNGVFNDMNDDYVYTQEQFITEFKDRLPQEIVTFIKDNISLIKKINSQLSFDFTHTLDRYNSSSLPLIDIKKPPQGLIPKKIHDKNRLDDIKNAVIRYLEEDKEIPSEWIQEYNDLCQK